MFCEKLQNIRSVAANPDQMDKNRCDFWTQQPQNPQIHYKLQVPKNRMYPCYISIDYIMIDKRFSSQNCLFKPKVSKLFCQRAT